MSTLIERIEEDLSKYRLRKIDHNGDLYHDYNEEYGKDCDDDYDPDADEEGEHNLLGMELI